MIRPGESTRQRLASRRTRLAVGLGAGTLLLGTTAGCGLQLRDVPMPSLVSGPTYRVEVVFDSALNLPVDAPVKLDGATVGQVTGVEARDFNAHVRLEIVEEASLVEGTGAQIRLSSPMGNAFVELEPPQGGGGRPLADGSTIGLARTRQAPDVNDLLSSLSVLVSGGPFADIRTIMRELDTALTGNHDRVRRVVRRLDDTLASLDAHTQDFDRALHGLDRLARQLAEDRDTIARGIRELTPMVRTLAAQREELMALLAEVRRFSGTTRSTIRTVREDLVSTLRDVGPVLESLIRTRDQLEPMMKGMARFARKSDRASPGDYANFDLTLLVDPEALLATPGSTPDGPREQGGGREPGGAPPDASDPPLLGGLEGLLPRHGGGS